MGFVLALDAVVSACTHSFLPLQKRSKGQSEVSLLRGKLWKERLSM
jgi:hypothetical protein